VCSFHPVHQWALKCLEKELKLDEEDANEVEKEEDDE
jgi:hypothetical protein